MEPVSDLQHVKGRQFRAYNVLIVIIMGLGSMSYGYNASIIATTLAQPEFIKYFELDTRDNANQIIASMSGLYQVGGFLGTFMVPLISDRWGRKVGIAASAALTVISGAFLAGSVNIGMFITFRFVSGFAAYMIVSSVPVWMSEVAPPGVRGVLVSIHGVAILFGFASASWVGYGFFHQPEYAAKWRGPLAIQCLYASLLLCCIYWMPESPRWLLTQDRRDEADKILRRLHAPAEAAVELIQIQSQIEIDRGLETSYWAMFTKPNYRKRVILCLTTTVGAQMTGPLVLNNYGPTIYKSLGYDTEKQFIYAVGWITCAVGGGFVSLLVVDRMARPKLLFAGMVGCTACLTVLAALIAVYATTPEALANQNTAALQACVAMVYICAVIFEITLDGGQFVYMSEIFPTHLRAKGISLGMAGLCLTNIMWLQSAPSAFAAIGWKFYLCFIIPSCIVAIFIIFYFPDTLGIPLEEIAAIFGDPVASETTTLGKETMIAEGGSAELEKHGEASHVEARAV